MARVERQPPSAALRAAATAVLALLLGAAPAADSPWKPDLGVALAQAGDRPMALLFSIDGCEACNRLKADSAGDPEVRRALEQVVAVEVRAERHPALVNQLGVLGFPALALVNRRRELVRLVQGYMPPRELATALRVLALHGDNEGAASLNLRPSADVAAILAGAEPVPQLVLLLGEGEPAQRVAAREALAGRADALPALWAALDHPRPGVRIDAAAALAQSLGGPGGFDPFAAAEERMRQIAAWKARAGAPAPSAGALP